MRSLAVFLVAATIVCGCARPAITNLGNGVGVPSESIDEYAKTHGITRAEARDRMREESNERASDAAGS